MRLLLAAIVTCLATVAPSKGAVVLGDWSSDIGFPSTSESPGYTFVTAHDEGTNPGNEYSPQGSRFYLFSITNNHPTKTIEVEEISLTLTGPGDGVAVFVGLPGSDFDLGDDFVIEEETTLVFSRASYPGVPLDVAPGETFYVSPVDVGAGFLVSNATITGTAVPEPSSFLLALTGAAALLRRRRQ